MTIVKAAIFLLAAASFGVASTKPFAAGKASKRSFTTRRPQPSQANLPFSQAVRVDDIWYLSGAIGVVPGKMELAPGGLEAEAKQTMENVGAILRSLGLSFNDVFKCTVMIADRAKWGIQQNLRYVLQTGSFACSLRFWRANGLALGAQIELECWALAHKQ